MNTDDVIARRTRAATILMGADASVAELKQLAESLEADLAFGLASKLLAKASEMAPEDITLRQQQALCTYKDEESPIASRLDKALDILAQIGLCDPENRDPETLALGGAIYQRMWEYRGQLEYLYEALGLYRAAFERNPEQDLGYGGVNAAYILDILASRTRAIAQRTGTRTREADELTRQARDLRERMAGVLRQRAEQAPQLNDRDWFVVNMAKIHFGLGAYEEAGKWLARARELAPTDWKNKEWEIQTTFRELVSIALLQGHTLPNDKSDPKTWEPAWQALSNLLGEEVACALPASRKKVGLALSGGGFRASLFHLGVLARLAEVDALRGVEVLSTVSGGSILAAHYYLEVQRLLQSRADRDISREAYIRIIKRLQEDFLAGVQSNIRMRALASLTTNLRMIFSKGFTLSHRLGELYEQELYARVRDGHPADRPRRMPDLLIEPLDEPRPFKPRLSNWRRRAKVPILLLNATALNTGHIWHFTASWMGEPPALVGDEVDANERLRRMYYRDTPTAELKHYRLGHAVAASACVPGMFDPLVIDQLYPNRLVRLVDGGVHDNQGIQGLLSENCELILCSDASGQMETEKEPSGGPLGVLARASSILMSRVREAEFQDLSGRVDGKALAGLFFVHLKKGLPVPQKDWVHCQDPTPAPQQPLTTTPYGVDIDVQRRLAAMRTDLDAFTQVEAYALMLSGYLMTEHELRQLQKRHEDSGDPGTWGGFQVDAERGDWPFLSLEPLVRRSGETDPRRDDLDLQLQVASSRFLRVLQLDSAVGTASRLAAAAAAALVIWMVATNWSATLIDRPITITYGGFFLAIILAVAGLFVPAVKWLSPERASRGIARRAALGLIGYVVAQFQLRWLDRKLLERGSLERLLRCSRHRAGQ